MDITPTSGATWGESVCSLKQNDPIHPNPRGIDSIQVNANLTPSYTHRIHLKQSVWFFLTIFRHRYSSSQVAHRCKSGTNFIVCKTITSSFYSFLVLVPNLSMLCARARFLWYESKNLKMSDNWKFKSVLEQTTKQYQVSMWLQCQHRDKSLKNNFHRFESKKRPWISVLFTMS